MGDNTNHDNNFTGAIVLPGARQDVKLIDGNHGLYLLNEAHETTKNNPQKMIYAMPAALAKTGRSNALAIVIIIMTTVVKEITFRIS